MIRHRVPRRRLWQYSTRFHSRCAMRTHTLLCCTFLPTWARVGRRSGKKKLSRSSARLARTLPTGRMSTCLKLPFVHVLVSASNFMQCGKPMPESIAIAMSTPSTFTSDPLAMHKTSSTAAVWPVSAAAQGRGGQHSRTASSARIDDRFTCLQADSHAKAYTVVWLYVHCFRGRCFHRNAINMETYFF